MPSRDASAVELICQNANDRKLAAKKCSELSSQLFFSLFVKVGSFLIMVLKYCYTELIRTNHKADFILLATVSCT